MRYIYKCWFNFYADALSTKDTFLCLKSRFMLTNLKTSRRHSLYIKTKTNLDKTREVIKHQQYKATSELKQTTNKQKHTTTTTNIVPLIRYGIVNVHTFKIVFIYVNLINS